MNLDGIGLAHKDSERWGNDPRRRGDDNFRDFPDRRSRRSTSRSRSPRRMHHSDSRSRSPRRSSRSPARYRHDRDRDDPNSKYAYSNGRPGGYGSRGRDYVDDSGRRVMGREMAALEASKRSIKENRVYVGNLAFSVKWNDLKDYMREGGSSLLDSHFLQPSGLAAPPISFAIRRGVGMMGWVDSFMKIGLRRAPGLTWVLSLTSYGCTARPDGQGSFFRGFIYHWVTRIHH